MLNLSPPAGDFGSVEVGKSGTVMFTLRNSGTGTTGAPQIAVSGADFTQTNMCGALNAGAMCTITVTFSPKSTGQKNGMLTVSGMPGGMQSASLTGTGALPGLSITPSTRDFGPVPVGGMTDPVTFTVSNTGTVNVSPVAVSLTGTEFATTATGNKCMGVASLAPGANCTVEVVFKPTSRGLKSGNLVATGGGQTVNAALSGTGQSPPQLAISPMTQVFGGQATKEGSPVTFTVANIGDASTTMVTVALGGTDAGSFKITSNGCLAPLPASGSCQVGVALLAPTAGMKSATLTASAMTGGMAVAMLSATVVPPSALEITPNAFDFTTVNVGATSAATTFTVKNTGGVATAPLAVTLSTSEFVIATNTCGGMALPATTGTCTISVSFKPSSMGQKSALLTVAGGATETTIATLNGTGVAVGLSISPAMQSFGSLPIMTSSAPITFTVTNTGGNPSGAVTASLIGANNSQWAIMGNTCSGSLAALTGTCTVTLVFTPTTLGDKIAQLSVTSTGGGSGTADLSGSGLAMGSLTVTSLPAGGPVGPTISGATGIVVGTSSQPATITVLNPAGALATGKLTFSVTNVAASEYVLSMNTCPEAGLAGGNSCTVQVTFTPTATGIRNASLIVTGAASGSGSGAFQFASVGLAPIAIAPVSLTFPTTSVGVQSADQAFVITVRAPFTNVVAATTGQFVLNGAFAGGGCTAFSAVVANTSASVCTQNVRFAPLDRTPAMKTGTLTATGTGGTAAVPAALAGTATGPLQVTPDLGEFGNVVVGTPSPITFQVLNNGGVGFNPITATLGGANASEFAISANACPGAVPVNMGQMCAITVQLTATSVGAKTATLTVNATLAGSSTIETQVINLTGTAGTVNNITATPSPLTFSAPLQGASAAQTVTVTNPGSATVNIGAVGVGIVATANFGVTANNCTNPLGMGQSCTILVRFAPTGTVVGAMTGTLTVTAGGTNTAIVTLNGTASATLTVTPTTKVFAPTVIADATSPSQDFVITNNGIAPATVVTSIQAGTGVSPDANDFIVVTPCASPIAAGATCTATVRYVPDALLAVVSTAVLQVTGTESGQAVTATATLQGSRLTDADVEFQFTAGAQTLDFGNVRLGTQVNHTITVTNVGQATTGNLQLTLAGAQVGSYALGNGSNGGPAGTCGTTAATTTTLAPGATCTVVIVGTPVAGANAATLDVTVPVGRGGATGQLTLAMAGVAAANIALSPNPADLGAGFVGTNPAAVTMTLTNFSGVATAALLAPTFAPAALNAAVTVSNNNCLGLALGAGASCTFQVQWTPVAGTPVGHTRGTITITDGVLATPAVAGAVGRKKVDATLSHSPATLAGARWDFGQVVLMQASADQTFVVTNTGERDSGPINLVLAGADAAEFTLGTSSCQGAILAALTGTCNVVVRYTPNVAGGVGGAPRVAQVDMTATPPGGAPSASIFLTGTTVLSALIDITVGGAGANNFGNVALGVDTTKTVTIHNRTNGQLTLIGFSLSTTPDFRIVNDLCGNAKVNGLGSNANCTIDVVFDPTAISATAVSTTLTVTASPGTGANVVIQGVGIKSLQIDKTADTTLNGAGTTDTFTISVPAGAANTGTLVTTLSGTNAALFEVTGNQCTAQGSLPTGADLDCTVTVRFNAGSGTAGAKTATLTVTGSAAGNNISADLTATE
jgi:hypothetical protein